jgi:hypothetical protein
VYAVNASAVVDVNPMYSASLCEPPMNITVMISVTQPSSHYTCTSFRTVDVVLLDLSDRPCRTAESESTVDVRSLAVPRHVE